MTLSWSTFCGLLLCCFECHNRLIQVRLEDSLSRHDIERWLVAIRIGDSDIDDLGCEIEVVSHDIDEFVARCIGCIRLEWVRLVDGECLVVTIEDIDIGRSFWCDDFDILAIGHRLGFSTIEWYDTLIEFG